MNRAKVWILAVFLLITAIRVWTAFIADPGAPAARSGVLDLSGWDLERDGPVSLAGEWMFDPYGFTPPGQAADGGVPVKVPGKWDEALRSEDGGTFGYGTYRLRILLSEADAGRQKLGLRVMNVRSAHRIFADGEEIGAGGEPGRDRPSTRPYNTPYAAELTVSGNELALTVHAANFHYGRQGGIFETFRLGTLRGIVQEELQAKMIEQLLGLLALALSIVFAAFYVLRRQNPELIWFGGFFFAYFLFEASHGEKLLFVWLPQLSYDWQTRIQFLSSVSIYLTMLYFTRYMFPRYSSRRLVRIGTAGAALLALLCLAAPVYVFTSAEIWLIAFNGLLSVYLIGSILLGVINSKQESVYALIGSLSLVHEHLFVGLEFIGVKAQKWFPIEMPIFMAAMGIVLAKRFFDNLERVEEASRKLKESDRMKSEFLANTSHELRTPLHGMINMAQLTLDEGGLDLAKEERLRLIVSTGRHLSHLLEDILDLSRLNEGMIQLELQPVDLRTAAESVQELLPYVTGASNAAIENRIDPGTPKALADGQRVVQILFNLLHNALKHADASLIRVEAVREDEFVKVTVADDGKGIPPDKIGVIFNEFQQAHPGAGGALQGTGLGLAITRKLVELQGGRIAVESKPGAGAAFRFTLPVAPEEAETEAAAGAGAVSAWRPWIEAPPVAIEYSYRREFDNAPRILLVEDDPVSLKVMAELLAGEKYSVDAVSDGRTALRGLTGTPRWDAVILDVSLPGKTGYELCRVIRQRFSYHELPVLFLTARSQPADLLAGFEAGANDYVLKPVDSTELKARVRTLLQLKFSAREKLHMEMALIQAQIKPHFLFNALNTIASLSETDPDRMREVLTDFGLYLKNSFDLRNLNDVVPFAMEWSLVESYLSVERARFGNRMRIVERVPESRSFEIPPLSIQPIVENALRHGILRRPEGGEVRIEVSVADGRVTVAVTDTGAGFPEGAAERILSGRHKGGIGLTNIHRRLLHLYGRGLTIEPAPGGGACVRFELPYKSIPGEMVS